MAVHGVCGLHADPRFMEKHQLVRSGQTHMASSTFGPCSYFHPMIVRTVVGIGDDAVQGGAADMFESTASRPLVFANIFFQLEECVDGTDDAMSISHSPRRKDGVGTQNPRGLSSMRCGRRICSYNADQRMIGQGLFRLSSDGGRITCTQTWREKLLTGRFPPPPPPPPVIDD